jgi:predicted nucleotidyltransferase
VALQHFEKQQVLNVYVFGSRAFGCSTESSDWDFICILRGSTRNPGLILLEEQLELNGKVV